MRQEVTDTNYYKVEVIFLCHIYFFLLNYEWYQKQQRVKNMFSVFVAAQPSYWCDGVMKSKCTGGDLDGNEGREILV